MNLFEPRALPRPVQYDRSVEFLFYSAYKRCLDLEDLKASEAACLSPGRVSVTPLICARFLGYMILEAPTDRGPEEIASDVMRCNGEEGLIELAGCYMDHFLRVFYTPSLSNCDLTPTDREIAAQENALARDGYRCMMTQKQNLESLLSSVVQDNGEGIAQTYATYIFPLYRDAYKGPTSNDAEFERRASAHAVLDRFGKLDSRCIAEELCTDGNVNLLQNILSLDASYSILFSRLKMWLTRIENVELEDGTTPNPNVHVYKLSAMHHFLLRGISESLEFTSSDPTEYPLPDPHYLAIHAACARVLHLSGARNYSDMMFSKIDDNEAIDMLRL